MPEDEVEKTKEVASKFCNRFTATVGPVTTRLAFGEAVTGVDAMYHSAVVMTTSDAKALAEMLLKLIGD